MPKGDTRSRHVNEDDEARIREFVEAVRDDLRPVIEGLAKDLALLLRRDLAQIGRAEPQMIVDSAPREPVSAPRGGERGAAIPAVPRSVRTAIDVQPAWKLPLFCAAAFVGGVLLTLALNALLPGPPAPRPVTSSGRSEESSRVVQTVAFQLLRDESRWPHFVQTGGLRRSVERLQRGASESDQRRIAPTSADGTAIRQYLKDPATLTWTQCERLVQLVQQLELAGIDDVRTTFEQEYLKPRGVRLADIERLPIDLPDAQWEQVLEHAMLRARADK